MDERLAPGGGLQGRRVLGDGWHGRLKSHARRDLVVFDLQGRLEQRGHAGSSAGVTNLADHRAELQGLGTLLASVHGHQRLGLLLVKRRQAITVGSDHGQVAGLYVGVGQRSFDGQTHGLPPRFVASRADSANDAVNGIPVAFGVGEPLEEDYPHAFAGHVAVGVRIERRPGIGIAGQDVRHGQGFIGGQVHATLAGRADHHVHIAGQEHVDARGECGQRGGGAGIQGCGPAHQVPRLGDARGERTGAEAAAFVDHGWPVMQEHVAELAVDLGCLLGREAAACKQRLEDPAHVRQAEAHLQLEGEIPAELGSHDHAYAGAVKGPGIVLGILERLVGRFQEHELEWIGLRHLLGRHLVGAPVVLEIGDKSAQGGRAAVGFRGAGLVAQVSTPTVWGGVGLGISARGEKVPEPGDVLGAGEDAGAADDRHGVLIGRLGLFGGRRTLGHADQLARGFGILIEHNVHIQAADAKGIHAGAARSTIGWRGPRGWL